MDRDHHEAATIEKLMHAAGNCHQMLQAVDNKLAKALASLIAGDYDSCRKDLEFLTAALPQAMQVIDHRQNLH